MRNLLEFNTFGVEAFAPEIRTIRDPQEIRELGFGDVDDYLILGGGSNLLFTGDIDRVVLKNEIAGFEVIREDEDSVLVRVGGGEIWHNTVMAACDAGFGGIENLALIPGTVGAAPVQNIGAYGVELAGVIDQVNTVEVLSGDVRSFSASECEFGYRSSFFKRPENRGRFFITSVQMCLSKAPHTLVTHYGRVDAEIEARFSDRPVSICDVRDVVISIRRSKLADPAVLGNAGSFFKNPIISRSRFDQLVEVVNADTDEPIEVPHYPAAAPAELATAELVTEAAAATTDTAAAAPDSDTAAEPAKDSAAAVGGGFVKVPAGWLVESLGWKGKRVGNTGTFENQALVLVNYGGATGLEIWQHAQRIQRSVLERYNIELEPEVNII